MILLSTIRRNLIAAGFALILVAGAGWLVWYRPLPRQAHHPGPPVPLRTIVLRDVQGYWGGQNVWLSADGMAVVQVVGSPPPGKSGLWEKRYRLQLDDQYMAALERLVGEHDFLNLKIPERRGKPDEAHPIIVVVTKDGRTAETMKMGSDKNADFDALYDVLLQGCQSCAGQQPESEGPFDWEWHPEGF
jgi:hypothetical protein